MAGEFNTPAEWESAVVDLSTNITTIDTGKCLLRGVSVTTALSAHACPITDGTDTKISIPASSGIGTWVEGGDHICSALYVDPDDSGTGQVTVIYKRFHDGLAGSGYSGG